MAAEIQDYRETSRYLVANHLLSGWGVVSLKPDGSPEHLGEALLWAGTALWALPCADGDGIELGVLAMIDRLDGALERVEPIGEYADGRQATLDGALGLFLGASRRVTSCGRADAWREPWGRMAAFQAAWNDRLNPGSTNRLELDFPFVRDFVSWKLGVGGEPADDRFAHLSSEIAGWAQGVALKRAAAFRVNLGLIAWQAIETAGGPRPSSNARAVFCQAGASMDIPTVDSYCGHSALETYLADYQPDQYEYRHQRAKWESPDGNGNRSPRLDRLVAEVMAYGWDSLNEISPP